MGTIRKIRKVRQNQETSEKSETIEEPEKPETKNRKFKKQLTNQTNQTNRKTRKAEFTIQYRYHCHYGWHYSPPLSLLSSPFTIIHYRYSMIMHSTIRLSMNMNITSDGDSTGDNGSK